jgi:hypothetical protein
MGLILVGLFSLTYSGSIGSLPIQIDYSHQFKDRISRCFIISRFYGHLVILKDNSFLTEA